jgi:hypothetical protein
MNVGKLLDNNLRKSSRIIPDENAINNTVKRAKEAYWIGETERYVSWPEFIYQQMFYINKMWWLFQAVVLLLLWLLLKYAVSGMYAERCMGITAPIFVILFLPELWKNYNYQSMEIEGAAFYSLQKVMAARMLLFGMIDLVLLTAFMGIGVASTEITMREMIIQFILPMVVTTCICLRLFTGHFARGMVPSIIASLFWLTLWTLVVLREDIYSKISTSIWIILIIFALLYMCYCIYRIMKETGQMYTYNMIEGI